MRINQKIFRLGLAAVALLIPCAAALAQVQSIAQNLNSAPDVPPFDAKYSVSLNYEKAT